MSRLTRLARKLFDDPAAEAFDPTEEGSGGIGPYFAVGAAAKPGGGSGGGTKPSLSISVADAVKPEGNAETTPFTFTVARSGSLTGTSTVNWSVSGGSGLNATDFGGALPSGNLTFSPGIATQTITVYVRGDTTIEANEDFAVSLSRASRGTSITNSSATGTILNDDVAHVLPVLTVAATDATKQEGNTGTTPFAFTVTRTGDTSGSSSAGWNISGADAADFSGALSGTVAFAAGETTQTITINVVGDTLVEPDENFAVTLVNPTGATLGTNSVVGTIINDDVSTQPATYISSSPNSNFNVEVVFGGIGWTAGLVELVQDSADIISSIITGDITNIRNFPAAGDIIDDVRITVTIGEIDGAGTGEPPLYSNTIAQTQDVFFRDASDPGVQVNEIGLPVTATILLDEYDVAAAINVGNVLNWDGVILHEMIHAVGFAEGITAGVKNLVGINGFFQYVFLGSHANNAYAGGSPLEAASGPFNGVPMPIFDASHWDDQNFSPYLEAPDLTAIGGLSPSQELMTAVFVGGFSEPTWLSDVTVGALKDIGYTVADPSTARGVSVDALFARHA